MKNTRLLFLLLVLLSFIQVHAQNPTQRIILNPTFRPFYHGVESGDPLENGVIIWTRVTPDSGTLGDIEVYWQIATDVNFTNIVNYGTTLATEENHYCAKVDVCGLQPATYYYYMFNCYGRNSIIGRTKTAPSATTDNDSARFAVVSCASWEHGYFNAYESISNRNDVDAVLHLGDYIYEYATGDFSDNISGRTYDPPTEAITEVGYELRYSQYKLDEQLRRIHQLFPFITVWDDHETANDAWREGAENHTPGAEGSYTDRKHHATNTYFKWMPIRKPDSNDTIRIFRKLRYGKLLDLIMLDTRLYDRDEQDLNARNDPNRKLMGPVERAWFLSELSDTTTRWKIVGNQVMFAPLEVFGLPVNSDQWDGYNYERTLIQNHILNTPVRNVVMLTGDIHTSWCNDVPGPNYNSSTGAGSVCVEFVGSSVTSFNLPLPIGVNIIRSLNPHMKFINVDDKGYYILDVKKTKTQADYTYMSRVNQLGATDVAGPRFYVNNNERHLRQSNTPVIAPQIPAVNPPLLPDHTIPFNKITDHYVIIPENTPVTTNVIPSLESCPDRTMIIVQGNHGTAITNNGQDVVYTPTLNYNGDDTIGLVICTAEQVPVCDTFYIYVTITRVDAVDTFNINLSRDSAYHDCLYFDDVATPVWGVTFTQPANGTVVLSDSCFTYQPNSSFSGYDQVVFILCDNVGCDTVVYIFRVDQPVSASLTELWVNKNSNITHCIGFDDLICAPATVTLSLSPANGTFQWVTLDSCFKYFPFFNYVGNDTMQLIGCDTCGLQVCDTVNILVHVEEPNTILDIRHLVVFGMFPNPVNDKLTMQYYIYEPGDLQIRVYDAVGKLLVSEKRIHTTEGFKYSQLSMENLPSGSYHIELKTASGGYSKMIIKE